ncbi:MAG: formylglycine-generating enzyme family protein [Proteobacteria bacterium]|nr:formylglycine-generating enzyme family protein [Pseudomonadota bacterium]
MKTRITEELFATILVFVCLSACIQPVVEINSRSSDTDSNTNTDSGSDGDSDIDTDTDSDSDSDADTDIDSDTDTDVDSDSNIDTGTETDTDTESQTDSDTDTDNGIDPSCKRGVIWIEISGGTFEMGNDNGLSNEKPAHMVTVPSFEMLQTEVTVEQYDECITDASCGIPAKGDKCNWYAVGRDRHPINCLSWNNAYEFCSWIGGRLPTEAEWEFAARSRGKYLKSPWGNWDADCDYAVMESNGVSGCGKGTTWPVCSKSYGQSEQGLFDMLGNVWEYVEDKYDIGPYEGVPIDGSAMTEGNWRLGRGGGFDHDLSALYATHRQGSSPDNNKTYRSVGIRCVRGLSEEKDAGPNSRHR